MNHTNKKVILRALMLASTLGMLEMQMNALNQQQPRKKNVILASVEPHEETIATNIAVPALMESEIPVKKPAITSSSTIVPVPVNPESPLTAQEPLQPLMTASQEAAKLLEESAQEKNAQEPLEKENEKIIPEEPEDSIEFNFENATLDQLISYISEIFNYTFITPDSLNPVPKDEKPVKNNLVSFKTNRPLSKQEAWELFITFIDMAGFAVVPDQQPNIWRIMSIDPAKRAPLPTYIGVNPSSIPVSIANSDQLIRYVYFIENSTVDALVGGPGKPSLLDQLKSPSAVVLGLKEHNAILMIDKAYNIINLMQIVKELDKVSVPQAMSVLKLRRADAKEVKELYDTLIKPEPNAPAGPNRLFQRKQPTSLYFPENTKIIAEPRSNSLILLGPLEAIQKIEDFIIQYVDVELDKPFSPLFVYSLRYADAENIANIMNEVTKFGKNNPEAAKVGGVRGIDQYFKPIEFFPEKTTNRLIIKGDYEDYMKAVEIIKQLDAKQPQIALEVLLLSVQVNDIRILGTQLRNSVPCGTNGLLGSNVQWATSGSFTGVNNTAQGIVTNPLPSSTLPTPFPPGVSRLLGNLTNLLTNTGAGNTIITLGDSLGAYALFQALQSLNSTQVLANPFLTATNKTKAQVSVGITQRVVASEVIGTTAPSANTFKDESANLTVSVVPLINSDGMITLDLSVLIENFIGPFNPNFVQKNSRRVQTKTVVANGEVIALGGLIQSQTQGQESKVPVLGDIPLLGWLFKNRNKNQAKDDLLVLIATQIIEPEPEKQMNDFTRRHVSVYENDVSGLYTLAERRDPIHRFFFQDRQHDADRLFDDYMFKRHQQTSLAKDTGRNRRRKRKNNNEQTPIVGQHIAQNTANSPKNGRLIAHPSALKNEGRA